MRQARPTKTRLDFKPTQTVSIDRLLVALEAAAPFCSGFWQSAWQNGLEKLYLVSL